MRERSKSPAPVLCFRSIWFTWPPAARVANLHASPDAIDEPDANAPGDLAPRNRPMWPVRLPSRAVIPLLASLVAAQTIALIVVLRQPVGRTAQPLAAAAQTPPEATARSGPASSPAIPAATTVAGPISGPPPGATSTATALSVDGERGAAVFIDGQHRGVAPLKVTGLAPGRHQVRLATAAGTATQEVTVTAGSSTAVLFPAPRSGWLTLRVPFNVTVFEGNRRIGASDDGPISLAAGAHTLTLRNDELGFHTDTRVTVTGGGMSALRPTLPEGILQVNALPWANVYVDGEPVGDTPLGQLRVPIGPHELKFVHPQLGERVQRVNVPAQGPARVAVDLR